MAEKQLQRYLVDVSQYTTNCEVASNCNSISFYNIGLTACKILNYSLAAGTGSLEIKGNVGELDVTVYQIDFGPTNTGLLQVIRKTYV